MYNSENPLLMESLDIILIFLETALEAKSLSPINFLINYSTICSYCYLLLHSFQTNIVLLFNICLGGENVRDDNENVTSIINSFLKRANLFKSLYLINRVILL